MCAIIYDILYDARYDSYDLSNFSAFRHFCFISLSVYEYYLSMSHKLWLLFVFFQIFLGGALYVAIKALFQTFFISVLLLYSVIVVHFRTLGNFRTF